MMQRAALLLGGRGRRLSTAAAAAAGDELGALPLAFPAVTIWGSNTCVGKTLFSAGLAAACRRAGLSVLYLKPVQTGFPQDSDARLVAAAAGLPVEAGPHAAHLAASSSSGSSLVSSSASTSASGGSGDSNLAKTLYAWSQPVSPHLAVEHEGRPVGDAQVAAHVAAELRAFAAAPAAAAGRVAIVETAGGVASPGPSGSLQCDLLRALRLPGVLVGDGRLGGISATLSAYESLALRGHAVPLVVLMDDGAAGNSVALATHLRGRAHVLTFPVCLPPPEGEAAAAGAPQQQIDASLAAWLADSRPQFDELLRLAGEAHAARLARLDGLAGDALRTLWWPFTQHAAVGGPGAVTVIDGRVGESFAVYSPSSAAALAGSSSSSSGGGSSSSGGSSSPSSSSGAELRLQYDACASWWTQGVSGAAQPALAAAVGAAAARYGHVMFPQNAHEPAVELAARLLGGVGAGWAARVFYTDDGSTAVEVALKMAFRRFMADRRLLGDEAGGVELQVLGLTEGYHGDTLGAMDAVAPSPFNGRLQTPWYRGRGLFLEPPTAALAQGEWRVALPADVAGSGARAASCAAATRFGSQEELFAVAARMGGEGSGTAPLYRMYRSHIQDQLDAYDAAAAADAAPAAAPGTASSGGGRPSRALGACIIEPVLQGAGGMRLIDPLYQRAMVDECRARGIPLVYDEVFTGLWRLGARSGAALLGAPPDVACYAKLLTGGTVPLAATLASQAVFDAFQGDTKAQALLHGHSYTAHPVGCAAGVAALGLYEDPALNPNWCTPEAPGRCQRQQQQQQHGGSSSEGACCGGPCGRLLPLWDEAAVAALSRHPRVRGVVPLGTVLALQLRADDGAGYGSNAAAAVVARLRAAGVYARPLGDVVYLMVTPMTDRARCAALLAALAAALEESAAAGACAAAADAAALV